MVLIANVDEVLHLLFFFKKVFTGHSLLSCY